MLEIIKNIAIIVGVILGLGLFLLLLYVKYRRRRRERATNLRKSSAEG